MIDGPLAGAHTAVVPDPAIYGNAELERPRRRRRKPPGETRKARIAEWAVATVAGLAVANPPTLMIFMGVWLVLLAGAGLLLDMRRSPQPDVWATAGLTVWAFTFVTVGLWAVVFALLR